MLFMANENETQVEETQEEVQEEQASEETQEETDESQEESVIDHQAELEKEREARKAAEQALAEKRFKAKNTKNDEEESSDDQPPSWFKEWQESNEKQQQEAKAREIANQMSHTPEEAEHIYEVYLNRVRPTGNIEDDIAVAHAIANRKKLQATVQEARKAAVESRTRSHNAASSTRRPSGAEPTENADIRLLKSQGFKWDAQKRAYFKAETGMVFDPKTGEQRRI